MDKEYGTTDEGIDDGCESCPNYIPCMQYEINEGECPKQEGKVIWKITSPGESTAFCGKCDTELVLGLVYYNSHNPIGTPGVQDFVCPSCMTTCE